MNTSISINDMIESLRMLSDDVRNMPIHGIGTLSEDKPDGTRKRYFSFSLKNGGNEKTINIPFERDEIKRKFDMAFIQKPLDSGLSTFEATSLFHKLDVEKEFIPIEIQAENSVAMGFISLDTAEELNYDYNRSGLNDFIQDILNDTEKENVDNRYSFNNYNIWLSY